MKGKSSLGRSKRGAGAWSNQKYSCVVPKEMEGRATKDVLSG
jgi:hypothetical protein